VSDVVLALISPHMKGEIVEQFQKDMNTRLDAWDVPFRVDVDGDYGQISRDTARSLLYGLGVDIGSEDFDGVSATDRLKIRRGYPYLSDAEKERHAKLDGWRKRYADRYGGGQVGKAISFARSKVGITESPAGSNTGPQIDVWNRAVGTPPGPFAFWCFEGQTLISTPDGLKRIDELNVGDEILSGTGVARPIVRTVESKQSTVRIRAHGLDGTIASLDHPYLVMRRLENGHSNRRRFAEPMWVKAGELKRGDMLAVPTFRSDEKSTIDPALSYVVGRYVADGWLAARPHGCWQPYLCGAHSEAEEIRSALKAAGVTWSEHKQRTVTEFALSAKLVPLLQTCGTSARNKRVPSGIRAWSAEARAAFLRGYQDGDGHDVNDFHVSANTISRELAYGIAGVARGLDQIVTVRSYSRSATAIIEGRVITQAPVRYEMGMRTSLLGRGSQVIRETDHMWIPVRDVAPYGERDVYDLTLDEEHTFIADGVVVHNCGAFVNACLHASGFSDNFWLRYCPWTESHARGRLDGWSWVSVGSEVQIGDLALYGSREADHVGLVVEVSNGRDVETIEGNTSSGPGGSQSNGGGVFVRHRHTDGSLGGFPIRGYARPPWN
jgi:hypothetical protein